MSALHRDDPENAIVDVLRDLARDLSPEAGARVKDRLIEKAAMTLMGILDPPGSPSYSALVEEYEMSQGAMEGYLDSIHDAEDRAARAEVQLERLRGWLNVGAMLPEPPTVQDRSTDGSDPRPAEVRPYPDGRPALSIVPGLPACSTCGDEACTGHGPPTTDPGSE